MLLVQMFGEHDKNTFQRALCKCVVMCGLSNSGSC